MTRFVRSRQCNASRHPRGPHSNTTKCPNLHHLVIPYTTKRFPRRLSFHSTRNSRSSNPAKRRRFHHGHRRHRRHRHHRRHRPSCPRAYHQCGN